MKKRLGKVKNRNVIWRVYYVKEDNKLKLKKN